MKSMPIEGVDAAENKHPIWSIILDFFRLAIPTYLSNLCSEALTLTIVVFAGQFNDADKIAGVGLASTTSFILCYSVLFGCIRPVETFTS